MALRWARRVSRNHGALDWRRWQQTRKAAFERDGYRCTRCGKAGRLEAHHDPPLGPGVEPYDMVGIKTRCRACHTDEHRRPLSPDEEAWVALIEELTSSLF